MSGRLVLIFSGCRASNSCNYNLSGFKWWYIQQPGLGATPNIWKLLPLCQAIFPHVPTRFWLPNRFYMTTTLWFIKWTKDELLIANYITLGVHQLCNDVGCRLCVFTHKEFYLIEKCIYEIVLIGSASCFWHTTWPLAILFPIGRNISKFKYWSSHSGVTSVSSSKLENISLFYETSSCGSYSGTSFVTKSGKSSTIAHGPKLWWTDSMNILHSSLLLLLFLAPSIFKF